MLAVASVERTRRSLVRICRKGQLPAQSAGRDLAKSLIYLLRWLPFKIFEIFACTAQAFEAHLINQRESPHP